MRTETKCGNVKMQRKRRFCVADTSLSFPFPIWHGFEAVANSLEKPFAALKQQRTE
jgi:hypothetical protein